MKLSIISENKELSCMIESLSFLSSVPPALISLSGERASRTENIRGVSMNCINPTETGSTTIAKQIMTKLWSKQIITELYSHCMGCTVQMKLTMQTQQNKATQCFWYPIMAVIYIYIYIWNKNRWCVSCVFKVSLTTCLYSCGVVCDIENEKQYMYGPHYSCKSVQRYVSRTHSLASEGNYLEHTHKTSAWQRYCGKSHLSYEKRLVITWNHVIVIF